MKFKSGLYRFVKDGDLFTHCQDSVTVRLTVKEAKTLIKDDLFSRLGFSGWVWLEE